MLTELCQELRNWFVREKHFGTFEIEGGMITAPFLVNGQYYRIIGSVFNDGVYQYGSDYLTDETFTGSVWALAIPKEVIKLAEDIEVWKEKYESVDSASMSPYISESFGGYSYQKSSGLTTTSGNNIATGWKAAFMSRLNRWRKI